MLIHPIKGYIQRAKSTVHYQSVCGDICAMEAYPSAEGHGALAALPTLRRQVLQQEMLRVGGETLSSLFMDPVGESS